MDKLLKGPHRSTVWRNVKRKRLEEEDRQKRLHDLQHGQGEDVQAAVNNDAGSVQSVGPELSLSNAIQEDQQVSQSNDTNDEISSQGSSEPTITSHVVATDEFKEPVTDNSDFLRGQSEHAFFKTAVGNAVPKETLCPCTEISSDDLTLMVIAVGMRHKLTWEAQLDILKMMATIFPEKSSDIPLSKYLLFKRAQTGTVQRKYHIYCPFCKAYLQDKDTVESTTKCEFCKRDLDVDNAANYFCSFSVKDQLKDLFQGPEQMGAVVLNHRANREKLEEHTIEDIYDGSEYKRHCRPGGILSYPQNFSYNFFTDGVPMGKSGKSIWPIYRTVNELPEKLRSKYIILAGLYIGPNDPNINEFMTPFVREANMLSGEGFDWLNGDSKVISKAIPMCAILDSVARPMLLNMQSFHAYFGCTFCYKKQEPTTSNKNLKFVVHVGETLEERTLESTMEDVRQASLRIDEPEEKDRHFRGVKGSSILMQLNYFDQCKGVVVDYMHSILIGVGKSHMTNLLSNEFKHFWNCEDPSKISADDIKSALDKRLLEIKPPKSITRTPDSIKKLGSWKASQLRSWIVFYCVVCLQGLLKDKYVEHIAMLSMAVNILLQKRMTKEDVCRAHDLLTAYQYLYQEFFGKGKMVYNVHLLSHVCKGVLRYGPIWGHNSFPYEGQNRYILQMCTSPFNVVTQVSTRYLINRSFPALCGTTASGDRVIEFCEDTLELRLKCYVYTSECVLVGKGKYVSLSDDEYVCSKDFFTENDELKAFNSLIVKGSFRVSATAVSLWEEARNINNFVNINSIGTSCVQKILLRCSDSKVFILVKPVVCSAEPILKSITEEEYFGESLHFTHVKRVEGMRDLLCVSPNDIESQCLYMEMPVGKQRKKYVCELPYGCYRD